MEHLNFNIRSKFIYNFILFCFNLNIVWGQEQEFNAKYSSVDSLTITDQRDGKRYKIIKIGINEWFAENLSYVPDSGSCWLYTTDYKDTAKYNVFYDWETACLACPKGWHLPSQTEYSDLINSVGGEGYLAYRRLISGGGAGFEIINCGLKIGRQIIPIGDATAFWTSTQKNNRLAFGIAVGGYTKVVNLTNIYYNKKRTWLPIRCVKNK